MCGLGVLIGAFGAHGLRDRLTPDMLAVFETGVRYHLTQDFCLGHPRPSFTTMCRSDQVIYPLAHALGLLAVAWAASRWPNAWTGSAGWLFVAGIVVFSGSLYLLAVTGVRWFGAITPIGGLCLIAGWVVLAVGALRGAS